MRGRKRRGAAPLRKLLDPPLMLAYTYVQTCVMSAYLRLATALLAKRYCARAIVSSLHVVYAESRHGGGLSSKGGSVACLPRSATHVSSTDTLVFRSYSQRDVLHC